MIIILIIKIIKIEVNIIYKGINHQMQDNIILIIKQVGKRINEHINQIKKRRKRDQMKEQIMNQMI